MRLVSKLFILIGFLLSAQLRAEGWLDYLPTNKPVKAKIMALTSSKEMNLISQKLQQAIKENPDWFKKYASQLKPGEKMPYHVNMGITQAEYEMILKPNSIALKEIGTLNLEFKWQEKNKSLIIKTKPASPIDGIIIRQDQVTTTFADLTEIKSIKNTNKNSPTGPWTGIQWSFQVLDDAKVKAIKFALGKLESTGEGILYYDVKDIDTEKNTKIVFSYISYYPLND